jgi:hypothetical protein
MAIGGLLLSLHPSHDLSFLQEKKLPANSMDDIKKEKNSLFIIVKYLKNHFSYPDIPSH